MNIAIQNAPNVSVSEAPNKFTQQAKVIAASSAVFQSDPTDKHLHWLKSDCIELLRLLAEKPKQAVFNVTTPSRCTMAENISISQAIRVKKSLKGQCLIKFAGMVVVL